MSGRYLTDLSLLACGVNWLSLAQIAGGVAKRGKQAARKTADRRRFASKLSRGLKTIDRFTLQETPCHDKRAKGGAEQHFCGAAVWNGRRTTLSSKERPVGKSTMVAKGTYLYDSA